MNSIKIIFFDIDGTLIDMRTKRISSYRSLDHRFHLRPPNCHRKGKGRRCQSRCVCGQKRQAQEKESMIPQSQKSEYSVSEYFNPQSRKKIFKKVRILALPKNGFLREPQTEPQATLRGQKIRRKVRKAPDFLSKSGAFMVAEAGLEPTTSGL